jgi:hypothetical protein
LDVVVDSQDNMETSVTKWKLSTNLLLWALGILSITAMY